MFSLRDFEESTIFGSLYISLSLMANCYLAMPLALICFSYFSCSLEFLPEANFRPHSTYDIPSLFVKIVLVLALGGLELRSSRSPPTK
jgi:hypothetical protein